jgi:hypothetical protein
MRRILVATGVMLILQGVARPTGAIDCTVSFDQRCLSHSYDRNQVEQNHVAREHQMDRATREAEAAAKARAAASANEEQVIQEQPTAVPEDQAESEPFFIGGRIPEVGPLRRSARGRAFGR